MAFKYSDYLLTPSDIFRGVLYVLANLRPFDVVGESIFFLILIFTKQVLGWGVETGILLAVPFILIYWGNAPFRKAVHLIKNLHHSDIIGLCAIIFIYIFTKLSFGWSLESIFFLIFLFATFYWNLDPRILISFALIYLLACPIFFFLGNDFDRLQGEEWVEHAAVWTFYFLVLGLAKQAWNLRKEKTTEIAFVEARDPITEAGLPEVFYRDVYGWSLNIKGRLKKVFKNIYAMRIPPLAGSLSGPSSARVKGNSETERFLPQMVFFAITCIIMLPIFLQKGYLFLLDMVWGPNMGLADHTVHGVTSNYPLVLLLSFLNTFIPAEFLQKALLFFILYLCGYWMYILSRSLMPRCWAILSGVFYILNPYVFERFLAGQWTVLLGYAIFPLIVFHFFRFLNSDRKKDLWTFILLFSIYPLLSLHWAYIAFWFLLVVLITYLTQEVGFANLRKAEYTPMRKKFSSFVVVQGIVILLVNSFWINNLWSADGSLGKISRNDFQAFSTTADPVWGTFFNVLSLYGFWQDAYILPKNIFPYWWALTLIIIAFSIVGFNYLAKKKNILALSLGVVFLPVALIATGYGTYISGLLTDFLFLYLPGFAGMRETGKVTGMLAFTYAIFFPIGIWLTVERLCQNTKERIGKTIRASSFAVFFLFCCLLVNNVFFGFGGQLRAWPYPDSWYEVKETLDSKSGAGKTLVLPWHKYLEIAFANNVIADNPAKAFFGREVISGKNLDSVYIEDNTQGEWDKRTADLLGGRESLDDYIRFLETQQVDRIILIKTADWQKYGFLEKSASVRKVCEAKQIILYEIVQ